MKIASIDIGTNSSRLLIVDYKNKNYNILSQKLITTRLGEEVDKNKYIKKSAINRLLAALKVFKKEIERYKVKKVKMVGTSALRDVSNSSEIKDLIYEKVGLKLNIIGGLKEAEYTYKGVWLDLPFKNFMIIDIGGGSTEFIWKTNKLNFKSLDLGAVRLTEKFITDVETEITNKEKTKIKKFVQKNLKENINKRLNKTTRAVGVGGTITTLGTIDLELEEYKRDKIHKYILKTVNISRILDKMIHMNLKCRKKIKGLNPDRADIIVTGVIILEVILRFFKFNQIIISENDLLFGLIQDFTG
ncbi:MAG: Ppx/GppA family phosphatase [Bacillota bacterium]